MSILIEVKDCTGRIIYSEVGEPDEVPQMGGTFLDPDIEGWHQSEEDYACDLVEMTQFSIGFCDGIKRRFNRFISEVGVKVCGKKIANCNGDCIILLCAS